MKSCNTKKNIGIDSYIPRTRNNYGLCKYTYDDPIQPDPINNMIRNFLNGYLHLHQGWAGSDFLKNSEPGSGAKPKFFARPGRERDREFNFPRSGIGIGIGTSIF